jgi:hypothetical protein
VTSQFEIGLGSGSILPMLVAEVCEVSKVSPTSHNNNDYYCASDSGLLPDFALVLNVCIYLLYID